MTEKMNPKRVRTTSLSEFKASGQKFSALTSYDHLTAEIFDSAGIEVLLVGDSGSEVVLGQTSPLAITLEEVASFGKAVSSAAKRALVVIDMPFGSYEVSSEQAVENAIRLMKLSGAHAIKLEGGSDRVKQIQAIIKAGIPVMGHIGFTPQSVHALGGFKVQGRGDNQEEFVSEAKALAAAGVFAMVLELMPKDLAKRITEEVSVPTIGIGAGNQTDGQILVWQDFAGLSDGKRKFVKNYLNLREDLSKAAATYKNEVTAGSFPGPEHSFDS